MSYVSAIAVDFGSSNSGAARIDHFENGELVFSNPTLLYSDGTYAKDATWFVIEPQFLNLVFNNWDGLKDGDFRILSRASMNTTNPNIIWGRDFIEQNADFIEDQHWPNFKYFKMMIYRNESYQVNGKTYPIGFVVKLFLRIIKIDCLNNESALAHRAISSDEVQWGVTIPSIWSPSNKRLMSRISEDVFGKHVRMLSEPEGPIVAERLHEGTGSFANHPGYKSIVIDAGGGTTDLCLVEDVGNNGPNFKLLASSDGIGIGGNNVDEAFKDYFLQVLTEELSDKNGRPYNSMTKEDLREALLSPYLQKLKHEMNFEKAWLNFKHGISTEYNIPNSYLKWLKLTGNKAIEKRVKDILLGEDDSEPFKHDTIRKAIFDPVYEKIGNTVAKFIDDNRKEFGNGNNISVIYAGGLSLSPGFRDYINGLILSKFPNLLGMNLAVSNGPAAVQGAYNASSSIMEGSAYILLNRKAMRRKAKKYIFDMFSNNGYWLLKKSYERKGISMRLAQIDSIGSRDIKNGGVPTMVGYPVAIKGEYYTDYDSDFFARDSQQQDIANVYYSADEIVVHPYGNDLAKKICEFTVSNQGNKGFHITIDFNESEIGLNMHCYVVRNDNGQVTFEENYPME